MAAALAVVVVQRMGAVQHPALLVEPLAAVVALVAAAAWVLVEDAGALVEDAAAAEKSKVLGSSPHSISSTR